jgi:hypothetical protein
MKIGPVGAELFHADGRTDITKLTVAFRGFMKVPKMKHKTKKTPQVKQQQQKPTKN